MNFVDFSSFREMQFPRHGDIIYVLLYAREGESEPVPFYVGQSSQHVGRFGYYVSANFSACTDFKVGEAVRYLRSKGHDVIIRYRESHDRRGEERMVMNSLRSNSPLLNDLDGYDYRYANEELERLKIHAFIDHLLANQEAVALSTIGSR